ncbi:glycosyltransferase family 4 protein [Undibacterium sp. TJN25]|uniref:glycosyltransferase family 4 protein n=1 Tax=Undibacterium sp. TJN25 TaxID=3413056 RepID=UPI003BF00CF8
MNVVLSIEAVRPPLAGIGRYAWELASRLPAHADIESVRYMADGLWKRLPKLNVNNATDPRTGGEPAGDQGDSLKARLRHQLGQSPLLSGLYGKLVPYVAKSNLRGIKDGIFHGPNYVLPESKMASVVTLHDLSVLRYPQWHPQARVRRMRAAMPVAVRRADLVITDSLATRLEVLEEFRLGPEQVVAVPLGVDTQFHPRTRAQAEEVMAHFGLHYQQYSFFVSTIEPRKNLLNLLAAYRDLPAELRQQYPLVLVGSRGWNSDEIHAKIVRGQQEGWLNYLGYVEDWYLPVLYAACRLFVYPSYYEGFGLPIAEAMASGVPVLTSNCSSMPEVADGAAWLVEPDDVVSIRDGLAVALQDDAWREQAISKGLRRAAQLTWEACVQNTVNAYQMIRGGK